MTFWLHTLTFYCCFLSQVEYCLDPQVWDFKFWHPNESGKSQERESVIFPTNRNHIRKTQCPLWKNNIRKQPRFWAFLGYILNARAEWLPVLSEQEETGVAKRALNWRGTSSHCPRWLFHEPGAVYYFSFSPRTDSKRHQNCMGLIE